MSTTSYIDELSNTEIKKLRDDDPEQYNRVQHLQSNGFTFITRVRFKGSELLTADSFHETFAARLQFPKFYGANMDAWIDVMDDILRNELWPMAKYCVVGGRTLDIVVEESKRFQEGPVCRDLVECAKFINEERVGYEYLRVVFE